MYTLVTIKKFGFQFWSKLLVYVTSRSVKYSWWPLRHHHFNWLRSWRYLIGTDWLHDVQL